MEKDFKYYKPLETLNMNIDLVLPPKQKEVAIFLQEKILTKLPKKHFFLVGGTAIALKYAHRQSIDFDFFSFPQKTINDELIDTVDHLFRNHDVYQRRDFELAYGQLNYKINDVGVTFFSFQNARAEHDKEFYKIPLFPTETIAFDFDTLSIKDLAGMKTFSRCRRSKMKDLIDIAEIIHHGFTLQEIINIAEKQFGYDISGKEILNACLNIDDIIENPLDEPITYLNNKDDSYYINFLKKNILEFYDRNA